MPERTLHSWPEVLPGGRAVVFTSRLRGVGVVNETNLIEVLDLETGEQHVLIQGGSHPRYVSSGHLVYSFADTVRAVRFDPDQLEVLGEPIPVLEQVPTMP